MVTRIGGFRRKTREKLRKNLRQRGKISLTNYFQKFEDGEKVCLKAESSIQTGMYFPRFHGKNGIIVGQKGKCYNVQIQDKDKKKVVVVHPVHLKKL